jgi:hypothetical protein
MDAENSIDWIHPRFTTRSQQQQVASVFFASRDGAHSRAARAQTLARDRENCHAPINVTR